MYHNCPYRINNSHTRGQNLFMEEVFHNAHELVTFSFKKAVKNLLCYAYSRQPPGM